MAQQYVAIERVGDRIHLKGWIGPNTPAMCKRVSGWYFSKEGGAHWTYPLTMETCRDLRDVFGQRLVVGPDLTAWAREQVRLEREAKQHLEVSTQAFTDAALENLPTRAPTLYAAMLNRPYQIPAVRFLTMFGSALEGDQPGLGKTLVAAGAIVERSARGQHLILAPKTSVGVVWEPELKRWLGDLEGGCAVFAMRGSRAQREATLARFEAMASSFDRPAHMFVIGNIEMVRTRHWVECTCGLLAEGTAEEQQDGKVCRQVGNVSGHRKVQKYSHEYHGLFKREWTTVVCDESHKALITTVSDITNKRMTLQRRGLAMLASEARLALTGTPFKGKTKNLWGTLNWLRPKQYTSSWGWFDSYLEIEDNGYGKVIGELRADRRASFYRSLDTVMIRRTKKELRELNPAWAPPEKQYVLVKCEMDSKQSKLYHDFERDASVSIDGGDLSANGILAEMTRLKQFSHACGEMVPGREGLTFRPQLPSAKFDRMLQMLEERGISGDADEAGGDLKVVLGSQFTEMINLYSTGLKAKGIEHFVLTGETSDRKREEYAHRFQQPGGPRVFLINTMAGGVSITLDAADELWVLDETWVPDDQEQLEDRVHRTGNTEHQVTIYYFVTVGTIEEEIAAITEGKDTTQKQHLDGRRGVEFAKKWVAERRAA